MAGSEVQMWHVLGLLFVAYGWYVLMKMVFDPDK